MFLFFAQEININFCNKYYEEGKIIKLMSDIGFLGSLENICDLSYKEVIIYFGL